MAWESAEPLWPSTAQVPRPRVSLLNSTQICFSYGRSRGLHMKMEQWAAGRRMALMLFEVPRPRVSLLNSTQICFSSGRSRGLHMKMEQWAAGRRMALMLVLLCCVVGGDAYDVLDPTGNITISWDFQEIKESYKVLVRLQNYQLYRHVEDLGWRLSWFWAGDEVIYDTTGAEATEQGNCSLFVGAHSCEKHPVIVDLARGVPYARQVDHCCRGGVLSSLTQNSEAATSGFLMHVGNFIRSDDGSPLKPFNFSIGVPGYRCGNAMVVAPTRTRVGKKRHVQALMTWQATCFYSQTAVGPFRSCCVSLSTFYSSTIVECPHCTCGACPAGTPTAPQCQDAEPAIRCTGHICPIRVHWHVKNSYTEYWRVKLTINNFNRFKNYSDWNLVVQHPNLQELTQVFSFSYEPLVQHGAANDTGLFWGLPNFNQILPQDGYVQTEVLLRKGQDFSFSGGWALPRKIYFDGSECGMPRPDEFPQLPSSSPDQSFSGGKIWLTTGFILMLAVMLV